MESSTSIWSCENVTKAYSYKGFQLKNINVTINPGEITGVVGENGNGKTTLLRIIAGELSIDSGDISFLGKTIGPSDWHSFKEQISYIPQRIPRWFGYLKTNLEFQASIHNVPPNEIDERLNVLLNELGLQKYADLKWSEISTGYRLRFQLAKMLIGKPKLLVLDEPIANLDIKAQEKFLNDLRRIVSNEEFQTAVILSSQQLHEVEAFSDNVIFLKEGDIKYSGKVNELGDGRIENTFEISCSAGLDQLKDLFKDSIINIEENGKNFMVSVDMNLSGETFISQLIQAGYTISYFRDISSSTKKMFS